MTRAIALLAVLILASSANAQPAQSRCTSRFDLLYKLANEYLETPVWRGIDDAGQMVEVYTNPETGTWTITRTAPAEADKLSACIVSTGEGAEIIPYDISEPS